MNNAKKTTDNDNVFTVSCMEADTVSFLSEQTIPAHSNRNSNWLTCQTVSNQEYKKAICIFAISHFLKFGMFIQLNSGTTLNILMKEIIQHQKDINESFELAILTTNLEVAQMGKKAAIDNPMLFEGTQVIITGGTLLASLNSLGGRLAAAGVRTELFEPDYVFLGVAGIDFCEPNGKITYHFEKELEVQESYMTRPTRHRIVICDHFKLGTVSRWKTEANLLDILRHSRESCTILSSYPSENEVNYCEQVQAIDNQIEHFKAMLNRWKRDYNSDIKDKQMKLLLVNTKSQVEKEICLW